MQSLILESGGSVGLLRYLRRNAEANVYPLFQVLRRHQVRMWRLETAERNVVGALVEGGQQLSPFMPDTWLIAEDVGACERLLDVAVALRLTGPLSVPSRFGFLLGGFSGAVDGVAEKHFVSSRQIHCEDHRDASIVWLTRSVLNGLKLGSSVLRLTGSVQNFPEPSWYLAIVIRKEIVALLEAGVATPDAIAVQQMFVEPGWRRLGLATSLLGALWKCAARKGRKVSYITESANIAALGMIGRAGFELIDERITIELRGGPIV